MSQALYRKWRPLQWDKVIGQEHVVQTLRNAVTADRVAHAYLFAGPRGTGKTSTARLLAKAVNCTEDELSSRPCNQCAFCKALNEGRFLDLIEIDAASNTSVDDVRDLRDKINFSPNQGRYKVYIIDEVHMLSTAAFNALLKTLEEPPSHAIFVLATTEAHKIPATVVSRCQRHEFRRIPVTDIVACLEGVIEDEGLDVDTEALTLIARQATGSMRDAISLLDQLASTGKSVTLKMAQTVLGTATDQAVMEVVGGLFEGDAAAGLNAIHRALDAGGDPRQFARQIVGFLRGMLLVRMGNAEQLEPTDETRDQMSSYAQAFTVSELLSIIHAFNNAATGRRPSWQPSLPLEIAYIESLSASKNPSGGYQSESSIPKQNTVEDTPASSIRDTTKTTYQAAGPEPVPTKVEVHEEKPPPGAASYPPLDENWQQVLNAVRQRSPNTHALLNSTKSHVIKDGFLILGFATDILVDKMQKNNNIEVVEAALKQVMGMDIRVRCRAVSGKQSVPPPDVDSDGMVASALRDLGGEIVDIQ
jgi:DNA polymerase-3 subunit gamma/tau